MYAFTRDLQTSYDEAVRRVRDALEAEGFGVLTEIDVKATLKEKLGVTMAPYVILGACNPPLARRAIEADPDIGALLPCNVIVREEPGGSVVVGFMDPQAVMGLVDDPAIGELAAEVRQRLNRVSEALD